MARSLWTIAELAWLQLNPKGKEEAKNTLEEYVETARDEFARSIFNTWLQLGANDKDLTIIENILSRKPYDVKEDAMGEYSELEEQVLDLPRDMGIFQVQPKGQRPLAKMTVVTQNYFDDDPGDRGYYRLGQRIYYPDGFEIPRTKTVFVTLVCSSGIGPDMNVPDIVASDIRKALLQIYGATEQIPEDTSNNKKADGS